MSSIIAKLIDESEEARRLQREAKEAEIAKALESLKASMKEYLGDFWTFLEERYKRTGEQYQYTWESNNDDMPSKIFYNLPAMPEEELAPILIRWGIHALHANYYDNSQKFQVRGNYYAELKDALKAAREAYPKYIETIREAKAQEIKKTFNNHLTDLEFTEAIALETLAPYLAEFPDRKEYIDSFFEAWKERRALYFERQDQQRREREEREASQALRNTLRLGYVIKLAEWMKEHDAIVKNNLTLAALIQEEADLRSYTVYKLTYALIASYEEDGETYREINTRSVWTLYAIPDSFGFWNIDGKKIEIYNPVTLEMSQVKPSSGILAKTVAPGGIDLYFHPDTTDEAIERIIAGIEPLPEEPEIPSELAEWDPYRGNYRKEARELLSGEPESNEVPF